MSKPNTIQDMLAVMTKNGWRITDQRRSMAQIFINDTGYLSPKDVYDVMSRTYPTISFDTVYRNLRSMTDMGVLEQFYFMEGGLKFKGNCLTHHHHHIICVKCEKTLSFDYCPMDMKKDFPGNFHILNHRFEVYGICEECS